MITWKVIFVVFIFDCAKLSLAAESLFDDDDFKKLANLISRWSAAIHRYPESLWMLNSFPHYKFKDFDAKDKNLIDDRNKWPYIDADSSNEDYDYFFERTTSTSSTNEDYDDISQRKTISTVRKDDNFEGQVSTTTDMPNYDKTTKNDLVENTDETTINENSVGTTADMPNYDKTTKNDLVENTDETTISKSSVDKGSTITTESIDVWNDNDTDALIIGIVELLKNNSGLINEVKNFIKKMDVKCYKDMWYAVRSKVDSHLAKEMLDAAGKPASGILRGDVQWLGDYRQCQNISFPTRRVKDVDIGGFDGLYCYSSWKASIDSMESAVPLAIGVCVPDSCSAEDLKAKSIVNFLHKIPVFNKIKSPLKLIDVTCQSSDRKWTGGDIAYLFVLSILTILIIAGTTCDLLSNRKQIINTNTQKRSSRLNTNVDVPDVAAPNEATAIAIGKERFYSDDVPLSIQTSPTAEESKKSSGGIFDFLLCFSVYSNASKVLTVGNQQGQISCLHGIRFLSLSWVIFGHVFVYAMTSVGNIVDALEDIDSFSFQVVSQATFAVDSFFLLSGLLLSYLYFKDCDKRGDKSNWIYYYVHRIWRLTPAFAMLLGFYTTLWIHLGSGPLWPAETEKGNCRKSWWWNLLYIVNFHDVNKNCMGWTWYLANDMQFYIISPLFLILLRKLPVVGIVVASIVTVGSWIVTGVLSAANDFRLFMSLTENMQLSEVAKVEQKQWDLFNIIYDKPYCRIGPYLIGLLLGYALYRTSGRQKFLNTWLLVAGWIVATFIGVSVVFGTYHVEMGKITAAFYNALSRSVWSAALGWVIFVCVTGHAGPVNKLLSWNFWVPLSRLTYCAYLVHPMIMTWYYSSLQTMLHFQMNTMVLFYFGYLLFAYLLSFIASMAFESPMMALEKFALKKFSK